MGVSIRILTSDASQYVQVPSQGGLLFYLSWYEGREGCAILFFAPWRWGLVARRRFYAAYFFRLPQMALADSAWAPSSWA